MSKTDLLLFKMYEERTFLYLASLTIWIICLVAFYLIWSYLSKKPLGMQTLFDQMVKDLLIASVMSMLGHSLVNIDYNGLNATLATAILVNNYFWGLGLFLQFFTTMAIRYLREY